MGCYINDRLIAVAMILPPGFKEPSVIQYMFKGGLKFISVGGVCKSISFMKMNNDANKVIDSRNDEHWTVELLTVDPKFQARGVGSKMIQKGIVTFVKKNGEKK